MANPAKFSEKNRKAVATISTRVKEMQNYTDRICKQLNMNAAAATAAEKAYQNVICGKRLLFFARHSQEEKLFLRLMIRLALATDPSLVPRAEDIAEYYGSNYGYEWVQSEISATVREEAKAMILSVGDSSYGESGTAAALAFARCHHQTLKHDNVGDFGLTYALAASLSSAGDFQNKQDEWRRELALDKLRSRRETLIGPPAQAVAQ